MHFIILTREFGARSCLRRRYSFGISLFIVPDPQYKGSYENKELAEAVDIIAVKHFPTEAEKKEAHKRIAEFCNDKACPPP